MGDAFLIEARDQADPAAVALLQGAAHAQTPGALLRLVLLGRMEAWGLASTPVLPRGRKARALLGILGLAAGAAVPRPRLGNLLWSRSGEAQRRGSLRQALHELQESLGETAAALLHADRDAVRLQGEGVWVDALEVARATAARPQALDLLDRGCDLLADLDGLDPAFDQWLAEQRLWLRGQAAAAAGAVLAAAAAPDARNAAAQRLLALDPGAQPAWHALRTLDGARGAEPAPRPTRRGARLGVLPLRPLGEGLPSHLALGLAESITEALARFRWIFVADCASLAAASHGAGGAETAGVAAARAMGLDFLLSGTLQAGLGPGRIRVAVRLTDLRDPGGGAGTIAWAQRFDHDAADLLALQDAVAAAVVARMDPEILLIEAGRAAVASGRGADTASAYDLLLRAMPAMRSLDRAAFLAAGQCLDAAGRIDPNHAATHAWHAYWHLFLVGQGWAGAEEDAAMAAAERLAARAVALDPMDAQGLAILGHVRAFLHHRVEEALALHRRALALNPNLAMAWVFLGMAESYAGTHEQALRRLDRYRELAPCHPHGFFFDAARGIPLLMLGDHAEAVEVGRAATALHPGLSYPYKTYLSALGHLGLAEEAARARARLLSIEPDFTIAKALRRTPVQREVDRVHYARGLRRAGLA